MPPIIIAVIAYAAGYITLTSLVLSIVSYAISSLLSPKPKPPSAASFSFNARDRTLSVRQPISPRRVIYGQAKVGGTIAFIHATNDDTHIHIVMTLAAHGVQTIGEIYINDDVVPLDANGEATGKYAGFVLVKKHLGAADQLADADLIAAAPDKWTAEHRLRGIAYVYVRFIGNADLFPNGLPNISAIVTGKNDIYDPRAGTTGYTNNAALCIADFLVNAKYGLGVNYATAINQGVLIASAHACDEVVPMLSGGTQPRYTLNGSFESSQLPEQSIGEMLSSMSGKVIFTGGTWSVNAGYHVAPALDLNEDHARGAIRVVPRQSRRDLFNAVKGVYVSPENLWQPSDFPAVTNSLYISQDNGKQIFRDVELPYTTNAAAAQRIAKIELEKSRQQIIVEFPCKLHALTVRAGDTVRLTLARFGWENKLFEVAQWRFESYEDDQGESAIGIQLTLRETASAIYDWNSGEETRVDPAPDTNLPNPFVVGAVSDLVCASEMSHWLSTGAGGSIARIYVTWTPLLSVYVAEYEVEFKRAEDDEYAPGAIARSGSNAYLAPVQAGGIYDVRIRAKNSIGVRGPWSYVLSHLVLASLGADVVPQENPVVVEVDVLGNAIITFPAILDPQITHYELRSGITFEAGAVLATTTGSSFSLPVISLAGLTLWIRGAYSTGGYTTITHKISFSTGTLSQVTEVSWRIAEPDLVFAWLAVPGASQYVTLFEDNGVTRTKVVAATEANFAIPKGAVSRFRVFAIGRTGNLSPYSDVSITLSGVYSYNEIVNIALPITTGKYVNLAFTTANQVRRVSLLGSDPVAPFVQNINDADLYAFGYNLANLAASNLDNVPASWFRDNFWAEKNGFFESGVLDLGSTLSGRLLLNLSKTVTHYGAGPASGYEHVLGEYLGDSLAQDLTDSLAFLSARLYVTNEPPNTANWIEIQNGDWVNEVRYVKLVVEVAMAGPLTEVTVTAASITLDVPDVTESGSLTAVTVAGRSLTFVKKFNTVTTVLVTARGPVKAYVGASSITNTGCTLHADSGSLTVDYFIKGY